MGHERGRDYILGFVPQMITSPADIFLDSEEKLS
jgi:hypothetical protein